MRRWRSFRRRCRNWVEKRVLNSEATEAAKEKLARIKEAFTGWIWTDPDRTDRLARIYNDRFNNLVPRHFDGRHLTLPGASSIIRLYDHQKRVIWRIVAAGSTYIAHTVGAGKSYAIAGAIMEQKRLGLINKAMLVVPGHCLAQVVARIPATLSDRAHPGRRRNQLREGEALPLPGPRGDGELGRRDHHPFGVPLHSGAVRLRARDDRGADRNPARTSCCATTTATASPASASRR